MSGPRESRVRAVRYCSEYQFGEPSNGAPRPELMMCGQVRERRFGRHGLKGFTRP